MTNSRLEIIWSSGRKCKFVY